VFGALTCYLADLLPDRLMRVPGLGHHVVADFGVHCPRFDTFTAALR